MTDRCSDARLKHFDRHVLNYVMLWTPYGGPSPDDAFPEFGMTPAELEERFCTILARWESRWHLLTLEDSALLARAINLVRRNAGEGEKCSPAGTIRD